MAKILLYCTKAKPYLYQSYEYEAFSEDELGRFYIDNKKHLETILNGKIVAKCDCENIEEIYCEMLDNGVGSYPIYYTETHDDVEELSCLDTCDLADYLPQKNNGEKVGYALYLSNVKVFDKPHYLDDLFLFGNNGNVHLLEKAPQNMCKVSFRFGGLHSLDEGRFANNYVLISIRPEWLFKILNGEKTIEVRKQILNSLKVNI